MKTETKTAGGSSEGSGMNRFNRWAGSWMRTFSGVEMIVALVEAEESEAKLVADDAQAAAAEATAQAQAERGAALR